MSADAPAPTPASPYSTGGGGVRLEHRYAATLLAAVLTGDPMNELGDDAVPLRVRLQASDVSPVDDVVVEGRTPAGELRRVSIGVRRAPDLTAKDATSVPLVRSFLQVITRHWDEVRAGQRVLALSVAVFSPAVQQTATLAQLAQSVPSAADFRALVARPGATNRQVRQRLVHLDALVTAAAADDDELSAVPACELTWRWLSALRVRGLRLEGVDESDRTAAVRTLRRAAADDSTATADAVFAALTERSGAWASAGAQIDQAVLRRTLSGFPLRRSATYAAAWTVLDRLARRLREGVEPDLEADAVRLELDRPQERASLQAAMILAGDGTGLVVTGEPDVGKSALTLRVSEALREQGAAVVPLSLRDLPAAVVQAEAVLGASLPEVLSAGEIRSVRLLVVDGAEAVLEGRSALLDALARAAFAAGTGVVAVTRTDGATRVGEVLRAAAAGASLRPPVEHQVGRLTAQERAVLLETFTSLARLGADTRADWLVGRPGLVAALLRSGPLVPTAALLSEADVYAAVWNGLVRHHEARAPDGARADEREQTVLAVARRTLGARETAPALPAALPGLRSDGVLRAPANPALAPAEEFATDLMRDLALCRLFLKDGWTPLREAGAPRWTIRAVRLTCQVRLLAGDRAATWADLRTAFAELSLAEGARWAEIPIEALLTSGDAQAAIEDVWPELLAEGRQGVRTLLRLAQLRYVTGSFGDPFALAPVIAVTFCGEHDVGQHDRYARGTGEQVRELVLAWLRGMVRDERGPDPLRQQIRARLLTQDPDGHDSFTVEALGTLGADTDDATEQWLRAAAAADPYRLHAVVESTGAVLSLAMARPELLVELAETYYIERKDDDRWSSDLGDGIRHHRHGLGPGPPFAAWYYGPFFRLLNVRPLETLAMINRMLEHAARDRVDRSRRRWHPDDDPAGGEPLGVSLDLPDIGVRHYVGDAHVWGWYRGSTVGPYPYMSALLAVERFADHLIATLGLPAPEVVQVLLRDCRNLAMPGLVFGLLARHGDSTATLLEPWLAHPEVWHLEFGRTTTEGQLHAQGPDADDVPGAQRRRLTPRDLAAEMTVHAVVAGDQVRLDRLAQVAEELVKRARAQLAGEDGQDVAADAAGELAEDLAMVQGWASVFRPDSYTTQPTDDGGVIVQYEPPQQVAQALAPTQTDLAVGNQAVGLQLRYAAVPMPEQGWPREELLADLAMARTLAADPPVRGPLHPQDVPAAVAAAAIISHARAGTALPEDDLRWAVDIVLTASVAPAGDHPLSIEGSVYPMGADRCVARAVPLLLHPSFDRLHLDRSGIHAALTALAGSRFDEVRTALVTGCAALWTTECQQGAAPESPCARHAPAWEAVQVGLVDCRLGPPQPHTGQREPALLPPPHVTTLAAVPARDLLLNRLAMPIACTAAARAAGCLSRPAQALLPVLLEAHRRGADRWWRKGYGGYRDPERALVARVLLELTAAGQTEALRAHLRTFAANAHALHQLLHDLMVLFTYDRPLRRHLPAVWDVVLQTTLDAIDDGADLLGGRHWVDYALGALLPTPQITAADRDVDATLEQARADWLPLETLVPYLDRWIALAAGEPMAADSVARLALSADAQWQPPAMSWVERLAAGRYDRFASRCWYLTHWLGELRESLPAGQGGLSQWRRIVDGLAGAGDSRAVDLQRLDE